jgi:nucleotide-binding universal stress UspA family protein
MIKFTRILYPTDLSAAAAPALEYAASLARWYEASLTVLHVVPTFDAIQLPPDALGETTHVVYPPTREAIAADMRRTLDLDRFEALDVHVRVETGDPDQVIVDQALTQGASLVVMGTHGRRGFDRLFHGAVAERVLRRAPCPVLMIPPHVVPAPEDPIFTRILCPIDFSPASQQAFGFALDLASQSNGAIIAMHVVEWMADTDAAPYGPFNVADYRGHLETDAEARLRTLSESEPHPWCEVTPVVVTGRSHREILAQASAVNANLIVMGSQGRGGMGGVFFGSTTQHVVRAAECPVLVVRSAI